MSDAQLLFDYEAASLGHPVCLHKLDDITWRLDSLVRLTFESLLLEERSGRPHDSISKLARAQHARWPDENGGIGHAPVHQILATQEAGTKRYNETHHAHEPHLPRDS